ncbi:MAG: hypothetical protein ABL895_02830 [Cyclobacteriaceae bacterium]
MEKRCFIIMPLGDPDGYAQGHFNRVYQYIIVPACRLAGFSPLRADDPAAHDTALDIIKTIIESDLAICDISANNPAALYGFAIRQASSLPVTLIKDLKTNTIANIPEFEVVQYDESLRIDTVQNEIETLSEALKKSFANKAVGDSLISRLNIGSQIAETLNASVTDIASSASVEATDKDEAQQKEIHLPVISPLPDFVGNPITQEEIDWLKVGASIFHMNYGKGEILTISKMPKGRIAKIQFESGPKLLVLETSGIFRKVKA